MRRTFLLLLFFVLCGAGVVRTVEWLDEAHRRHGQREHLAAHLRALSGPLQSRLDALVARNEALARRIQERPGLLDALAQGALDEDMPLGAPVIAYSFTRGYILAHVYPMAGNEAIVGMDYTLNPEFLGAIRRSVARGATVIDGPHALRQTGRPGIIVRTPVFAADGGLVGMVATTIDLSQLWASAGFSEATEDYRLLVRWQDAAHRAALVYGDSNEYDRAAAGPVIRLADGSWQLRGRLLDQALLQARAGLIRGVGSAVLFLALLWWLYRRGVFSSFGRNRDGLSLRWVLLLTGLLPALMFAGLGGTITYTASHKAVDQLLERQMQTLARQLRARLEDFFMVPWQAVFNADFFRQGLFDPQRPENMLRLFVAQLRLQPQLTFLSVGTRDGDYYAASRPPFGDDQNLRIQMATRETGRQMRIYWTDDRNRPSVDYLTGSPRFDARDKVWYQRAKETATSGWYPVYAYSTHDQRGQYEDFGMGVSAPLYGPDGSFLGVISADLALSRLAGFLRTALGDQDGLVFITDDQGDLLTYAAKADADSSGTARMHQPGGRDGEQLAIHAAKAAMQRAATPDGHDIVVIDGHDHLLDWQAIQLPEGPRLTMGVLMSRSRLSASTRGVAQDAVYLLFWFLTLGSLTILLLAVWLTQPLVQLRQWARGLTTGGAQVRPPQASPIAEIATLSLSLQEMAGRLQRQASELEQRVAARTGELAAANARLEMLTVTDELTGIANRRHFNEFARAEWARAARHGHRIAFMMIDIDWFKSYNDHHGHPAGDATLVHVARALNESLHRPGELVARVGGEEFAVVQGQASAVEALAQAERLRARVAALEIPHAGSHLSRVTISIGLVVLAASPHGDFRSALERADEALYRAKARGRNSIEWLTLDEPG